MNKNTRQRNDAIRDEVIQSGGKKDGSWKGIQNAVISKGSGRLPVTMAFTNKWESNSAYRWNKL